MAVLCRPHRVGVPHGSPPFYVKGCPKCEAKLDAGLVTKDTPPPPPDRYVKYGQRSASSSVAAAIMRRANLSPWRDGG